MTIVTAMERSRWVMMGEAAIGPFGLALPRNSPLLRSEGHANARANLQLPWNRNTTWTWTYSDRGLRP